MDLALWCHIATTFAAKFPGEVVEAMDEDECQRLVATFTPEQKRELHGMVQRLKVKLDKIGESLEGESCE
jgi:hypothetical protein